MGGKVANQRRPEKMPLWLHPGAFSANNGWLECLATNA